MEIAIESEQPSLPLAQQHRRVHIITDRFSMANTYLVNEERIIVVDPGSDLNVRMIQEYLQYFLHRPASDIDLIVLTRLHPDHTGGVELLRQICHAPVAASIVARNSGSKNDHVTSSINRLSTKSALYMGSLSYPHIRQVRSNGTLSGALHHLDVFAPHDENQAQMIDLWLEDVAGLPNHLDWRVIASPGHTPESLCLYNPFSYELLSGDTIITLDGRSKLAYVGPNRRQLEMTLQTLRSLKIHYLYPGHGRQILSNQAIESVQIE